jgi:predicted methyltransferase
MKVIALVVALTAAIPAYAQEPDAKQIAQERQQAEIDVPELVKVLDLKPGMTVADVGAGGGAFTVVLGHWIGDGRVLATDIGERQLREIRAYAEKEGLKNVTVIEGAAAATNLPPSCCDAIFMRDVYHHITATEAFDKSLLASLKPGGRLAIIDFRGRPGSAIPAGVPANRGGHGIPPEVVVDELTAAGFTHVRTMDPWLGDRRNAMFLVLFQKPVPAVAAARPEPNALGQPLLDAAGNPREDAFFEAPLAPEDAKYRDLQAAHLKQILLETSAISQRDKATGNLFWGRNVGTSGHGWAQDWAEAYFKKHNLQNVHRKTFDLAPQWAAKSYDIQFSAGGKSYKLKSARPAEDSMLPAGGLDLDVVWTGTGSAADFAGRDVKGKAVLIQDIPTPGVLRHSIALEGAIKRAFDNGAAAVGMMYGISDNFALWELPTGGRPGFVVGYEDGKVIRDLIGQGQRVTANLRLDAEERSGLKTASVIGTLPGATDEEVIVIAHLDAFFDGALDNGSGLAVMMGLLEHFAKVPQSARKRGIRFIASAGHHGGPGTRWLYEDREKELARTALMINLEHVSVVRTKYWGPRLRKTTAVAPMRWWVWGGTPLLDVALNAFKRFNISLTADMDDGASGEMGQVARSAPSIQVISSPEVKHTEQDTAEWVPAVGLQQIARAYARIIDDINKYSLQQLRPAKPAITSAR